MEQTSQPPSTQVQTQTPVQQAPPAAQPHMPPPPPSAPTPQRPNKKPLILVGALILLVIIGILFYTQVYLSPKEEPPPAPTPTSTPTSTPIRELSSIAGEPAFAELELAVASLSSEIRTYNVQDPSLSPPSLILPLGFPK